MTVMTGRKGMIISLFHAGSITRRENTGSRGKHYAILEKRMVSQFGLKPTPHDLVKLLHIIRMIRFF